jgi:hypothetical protein
VDLDTCATASLQAGNKSSIHIISYDINQVATVTWLMYPCWCCYCCITTRAKS